MADESGGDGLRERLARQGEDALGKIAQDLLENPIINGAIARAFEAREKAAQAQEVAFGALNLPSAADMERLTRRVRSLSQRLEGIEDGVDRLDERLASLQHEISALRKALPKPQTRRSSKPSAKATAAETEAAAAATESAVEADPAADAS